MKSRLFYGLSLFRDYFELGAIKAPIPPIRSRSRNRLFLLKEAKMEPLSLTGLSYTEIFNHEDRTHGKHRYWRTGLDHIIHVHMAEIKEVAAALLVADDDVGAHPLVRVLTVLIDRAEGQINEAVKFMSSTLGEVGFCVKRSARDEVDPYEFLSATLDINGIDWGGAPESPGILPWSIIYDKKSVEERRRWKAEAEARKMAANG